MTGSVWLRQIHPIMYPHVPFTLQSVLLIKRHSNPTSPDNRGFSGSSAENLDPELTMQKQCKKLIW
jgi:hypothetical protein